MNPTSQNLSNMERMAKNKQLPVTRPIKRKRVKWKRNWPCVCGSEIKFKNCCMKEMQALDLLDGNCNNE